MTDPQSAAQRLRHFIDAATPWLPDHHSFGHFGNANDTGIVNPGANTLYLGDIKHAVDHLEQIRRWAASTEHGAAAAEILALLNAPTPGCGHGAEYHGPEAGCVECSCTSTTGHHS